MADELPCDWPVSYAGCPGNTKPQVLESLPASGQAIFERMAGEYLWNWTGRAYGLCEVTVEPCRQDCLQGISTFNGSGPFNTPLGPFHNPWTPVLIDGLWFNVGCGRCGDKCGCDGKAAPLKLPGPIQSVSEVAINGTVLDSMAYYVNNHAMLVRADDSAWPDCGLRVTYTKGSPVPIGGQIAAGVLAAEFAKAACNDKSCALPQRVQSITRQGVTIAVLDAFDDIDKGHTGIFIIDSWIASVTKIPTRSHVLSPDKPRSPFRRKTWPLT